MEDAGKDFKWDNEVIEFSVENLEDVDIILLGRKTAEGLIPFWDEVATIQATRILLLENVFRKLQN